MLSREPSHDPIILHDADMKHVAMNPLSTTQVEIVDKDPGLQ